MASSRSVTAVDVSAPRMALSTMRLVKEMEAFREEPIIRQVLAAGAVAPPPRHGDSDLAEPQPSAAAFGGARLTAAAGPRGEQHNLPLPVPRGCDTTAAPQWLFQNPNALLRSESPRSSAQDASPGVQTTVEDRGRAVSPSHGAAQRRSAHPYNVRGAVAAYSDADTCSSRCPPQRASPARDYATSTRRSDVLASSAVSDFPLQFSSVFTSIPDVSMYPLQRIPGGGHQHTSATERCPASARSESSVESAAIRQLAMERAQWAVERETLLHRIEQLELQLAGQVPQGVTNGLVTSPNADARRLAAPRVGDSVPLDVPAARGSDGLVPVSSVVKLQEASVRVMEQMAADATEIMANALRTAFVSGDAKSDEDRHVHFADPVALVRPPASSPGYDELHSRAMKLISDAVGSHATDW